MVRQRIVEMAAQKHITTAAELTRKAGIGVSTAQRIFQNPHYMPDWKTLADIARALDVKVSDLIIDEPEDK